MSNERVSTGSLGERLMLRTRSTRGSVRETLSKAIRSTLGRTSSVERKGRPDYPKFGTALTTTTSKSTSPKEMSSDSGDGDSPRQRNYSSKDCARIYFSNTSSDQSSRSNSSTPRRIRHTPSSSGYGSLSHLPPIAYKKNPESLNSFMSQSMYVQSPGHLNDERRPMSVSQRKLYYEDSSETFIPSSPSLTTLKDFMLTNDDEMIEDEFDFDNDDVKSVVSSASTSRLFSVDCRMSKYQKNLSLRQFLNSPVRLRKRGDTSRRDAVEAGFEPRETVPRCHSTQSLRDVQRVRSYTNSQFQASDLSLNPNGSVRAACDSTSGSMVAPTAIVNPAQQINTRQHHNHSHRQQHHMSYEKDLITHHHIDVDRRRSLQALNGSSTLYQISNGSPNGVRSQFSPSDLAVNTPVHHVGSRVRVASVNQICDSSNVPQFSIDQRRSVQNIGNPVRNSFVDGIKTHRLRRIRSLIFTINKVSYQVTLRKY
uniref:SH2 domain-containing adapter protein F n=2 Tax=Caenorhabditis tropicalis TaxID=1561998 RepID=A0A1I7T1F8_9PELO